MPRLVSSLPEEMKIGTLVGERRKEEEAKKAAGGEGLEAGEEGRRRITFFGYSTPTQGRCKANL